MQIYFWITLGLIVASTWGRFQPTRIPRRVLIVVLLVASAAAGIRAYAAGTRPLPPGTAVGVFDWQPGEVRWTKSRAVLVVPVEGRVLRLWVAFPIVREVGREQTVEVMIDDETVRRLTLDTPDWKLVEVPVDRPRGSAIRVGIRVGYTIVPAAIGVNTDARRLGVLMQRVAWAEP